MDSMQSRFLEVPNPVGIDVGLTKVAVLSDGTEYGNTREYRKMLDAFRREGRKLSCALPNTEGYRRIQARLAHMYSGMADRRREFVEKTSLEIVRSHTFIAMEDLSVKGLRSVSKGRSMNISYSDSSMGRLRERILCKAMEAGRDIVLVDPRNTSQMCSRCGGMVNKGLEDRMHVCPGCGLVMDRDLNAAKNILKLASVKWMDRPSRPDLNRTKSLASRRGTMMDECNANYLFI